MHLILPVSGQSSRFPNMRPKWLLTMPNGNLMFEESVSTWDFSPYNEITLVCLREHVDKYTSEEILIQRFQERFNRNLNLVILNSPTSSASETIYKALQELPNEPFVVKDCDNTFDLEMQAVSGKNIIGYVDLNKVDLLDAKNKSYVEVNDFGKVVNIIEKVVISDKFCCGVYGFASSREFMSVFEKLSLISDEEIYLSHIIHHMLLQGTDFEPLECFNYVDWGTHREFLHFKNKFRTIFLDFDGVCVENSSAFAKSPWAYKPLVPNMSHLKKLHDTNTIQIVVTTARPESERENIERFFAEYDITLTGVVCGLSHASRVLVNDFSVTNAYPTASAINLKRDAEDLNLLL